MGISSDGRARDCSSKGLQFKTSCWILWGVTLSQSVFLNLFHFKNSFWFIKHLLNTLIHSQFSGNAWQPKKSVKRCNQPALFITNIIIFIMSILIFSSHFVRNNMNLITKTYPKIFLGPLELLKESWGSPKPRLRNITLSTFSYLWLTITPFSIKQRLVHHVYEYGDMTRLSTRRKADEKSCSLQLNHK